MPIKVEEGKIKEHPGEGCEYWLECLTCPLSRCQLDMAPSERWQYSEAKIWVAFRNGVGIKELAKEFNLSTRKARQIAALSEEEIRSVIEQINTKIRKEEIDG